MAEWHQQMLQQPCCSNMHKERKQQRAVCFKVSGGPKIIENGEGQRQRQEVEALCRSSAEAHHPHQQGYVPPAYPLVAFPSLAGCPPQVPAHTKTLTYNVIQFYSLRNSPFRMVVKKKDRHFKYFYIHTHIIDRLFCQSTRAAFEDPQAFFVQRGK